MAIRPLYCILTCLLLHSSWSLSGIQAQPTWDQPIEDVVAENAFRIQYLDANLNLQRHFLKHLTGLQANGHAAWLEVARQQLVVDQMLAQKSALNQYMSFVGDISKAVGTENIYIKRTLSDPAPLKIYSNDSIRLIGWVEPDALSLDWKAAVEVSAGLATEKMRSIELRQKQEQAQRRYRIAMTEERLPQQVQEQLRLKWELTAAHRALVQHQQATQTAGPLNSMPVNLGGSTDFITTQDSEDLLGKTTDLIHAETQAKNLTRFYTSNLLAAEESLNILQDLFQRNLITQPVLQASQQRYRQAQAKARLESNRLERLKQALGQLVSEQEMKSPGSRQDWQWPRCVLEDAFQLQHLLNLREQHFILAGQRESARLELGMRRVWLEKLQQTLKPLQIQQAGILTEQNLDRGPLRESQKLTREIEQIQRLEEHLAQQQVLVGLEEQRFLTQCLETNALIAERKALTVSTVASARSPRSVRMSYFEVSPTQSQKNQIGIGGGMSVESSLQFHKIPDYPSFWVLSEMGNYDARMGRWGAGLSGSEVRMAKGNVQNSKTKSHREIGMSTRPSRLLGDSRDSFDAYRYYQYGALKISSRRNAKVGQTPWFLPGSPSNYRGPR